VSYRAVLLALGLLDPRVDPARRGTRGLGVLVLDRAPDADNLPRGALVPEQADPGHR